MEAIRGNQAYFLPKNTTIVKENKDHNVEVARLLDYDPGTKELLVENQDSGKVQKWLQDKSVNTVKEHLDKKENQLRVASEIIAGLTLRKENLSEDKKLNLLA
ncbi:MAG: hypothetical protein A2287_10375 [Candidatus Melainabacteria bacterium RIFOXYA12_FULL_32_12]|nr:MAG: hypothetical protein A2104_06565 [Candidatus Melainabacteria bacterium GWF2_32_7]OGI22870.1 MAG: hypothetical protein A2255_05550 [Candidatus Melainabacteria bacterium RIFOXYA2_FULL_32_9]OGI29186.1 MAG: hypothetical protein A2287_10375 [Candidatus Melainabacteria bacterium RIFOXYA12_FULL_32_12]